MLLHSDLEAASLTFSNEFPVGSMKMASCREIDRRRARVGCILNTGKSPLSPTFAIDDDNDDVDGAADAVGKSPVMSCNSVGDVSRADDDKGNVAKSVGDNENFMLQGADGGIVSRLSLFKQSILSLLDEELNDIASFKLLLSDTVLAAVAAAAAAAAAAAVAAATAARSHSSTH